MKAKDILLNKFTISLVLMVLLVVALIVGVMFWLDSYTRHGEQIVVPDVSKMNVSDATKILADKGLRCEVFDSTFVAGKKPSEILEQTPVAGSKVKSERTIYVSINSTTPPKVTIPDLVDNSVRQAEATLKSIGIKVSNYEYVPAEYKDLLIGIKHDNLPIKPGDKLTVGSTVSLVVGRGQSNEEVVVISLRGLNLQQAVDHAHAASLNIGGIHYDVPPTTDLEKSIYVVYKQSPITGRSVNIGQPIDVYMTKDKTQLGEPEERYVDTTAKSNEENLFE